MIIVTGGAGFIGSVLVHELNKMGRTDIIIVDRLRDTSKWKNLRGVKYQEYFHSDDFLTYMEEVQVGDEIDCIFHMGACSSTTEKNMDFLMKNNVDYSKLLFTLASQLRIPFIYASSAATYGDGELGYDDDHDQIKNFKPLNPYGYSKQVFDEWVIGNRYRPAKWAGFKFFNVYGPNEYHKDEMRSLVHKAFGQINETGKVKLFKSHKDGFKDGEQLRDFVYAKDVALAMIEFMRRDDESISAIYNMGTGEARSFKDLVSATFKAMDKSENIEFIDMPESIRGQYQYYTKANMNKFKTVFPKFKFRSIEEGVADYIKNHLNSSDQYINSGES